MSDSNCMDAPAIGVHPSAAGLTTLTGTALALFESLDRLFLRTALEQGCRDAIVPPLIAATELAKIDYFASFPHQCTFAVSLDERRENLEAFAAGAHPDAAGAVPMTALSPVQYVLTPAACYHAYVRHQGERLDSPLHWTTRASCFRRERAYAPLRRQWSFAMREWVCVGSEFEVRRFLRMAQNAVEAFVHQLRLHTTWRAATDPFFDPSRSAQYVMQKLSPLKTELIYGNELALGSVNFHRDFLGRAFGIRSREAPAFSGCVAFGLERWMYAILDRFGEQARNWPAALQPEGPDA